MVGTVTLGTNIASYAAQRRVAEASARLSNTLERLASGQRINGAADDAASLGVTSHLDLNARVYSRAILNINDGLSLIAVAESALHALRGVAERQSELAFQAANGSYSAAQRDSLNRESAELQREFQRILDSTEFNQLPIFNGESSLRIQAGKGAEASLVIDRILFGEPGSSEAGPAIPHQDGTFAAAQDIPFTFSYDAPAAGDMNGDGNLDLILASGLFPAAVVFHGDGAGNFTAATTLGGAGLMLSAVEVADLDANGKLDVVAFDANSQNARVWLQQSNGTFTGPASYAMSAGFGGYNLELADINGDSHLDLLAAGSYRLGTGTGTFSGTRTNYAWISQGFSEMVVGDVDGDSDNDILLLANYDDYYEPLNANLSIWRNDGSGGFTIVTQYDLGLTYAKEIALADFNGDSKLDVAHGYNAGLSIRTGTGDGFFNGTNTIALSGYVEGLASEDIDDDGDIDLVVSPSNLHVVLKNSGGTFSPTSYAAGGDATNLVLADLNGDDFLDIFSHKYWSPYTGHIQWGQGSLETGPSDGVVLAPIDLSSVSGALSAISEIKTRMENIGSSLDKLGAAQSRLHSSLHALQASVNAHVEAASRIRTADIAEEATVAIRQQLLQNVGAFILAQANQQPAVVLSLIT